MYSFVFGFFPIAFGLLCIPGVHSLLLIKNLSYDKPHITKLILNYAFGSPRNGILAHPIQARLVSTSEA